MKRLIIAIAAILVLQLLPSSFLLGQTPKSRFNDFKFSARKPTATTTTTSSAPKPRPKPGSSNSGVSYKTTSGTSKFLPSRPANFDDVAVWRLQVKITTDGRKDANTDDEVYVHLNGNSSKRFYLDKGGDDREKNRTDVYDIVNTGITKIGDIRFLKLAKQGTDGWCIKKIEVLVNNVPTPIYRKYYSSCKWIDGNDGHPSSIYISGSQMRQYSGWKYTSQNQGKIWLPPLGNLPRDMFENIVESMFGHLRHVNNDLKSLYWGKKYGSRWVEASYKANSNPTIHFDLDLAKDVNNFFDPEVDVDFDLVFSCANGRITLELQNPTVKGYYWGKIKIFTANLDDYKLGNFNTPFCPSIQVNGDGSVRVGL